MDTQLGYWRWKLYRWNDHPNPYRNRTDLALDWLTQFKSNPTAMAEFKNLLNGSLTGGYATTDQAAILQQLADKMASGEIHVCAELCGPIGLTPVVLPIDSEPDISELPSAPPPAPAPAPAPDPPAESTLSGNNDPASQAQALKDAAESGEPFCEECEKAAQAARPPIPDDAVESSLSPDTDPEAQAQALKNAAKHGAFFCEECEKARRAAEETLSPNNDAVAQATALKEASRRGACFCEECEKARQALAAQKATAAAPSATPPSQSEDPAGDDDDTEDAEDDAEEDEDN